MVELLVVIAVVGLLALLSVPVLTGAIERGRVATVLSDLRTIEVALETYWTDHGAYPPMNISCMGDDADEVMQLPMELADGRYLPQREGSKTSSILLDPFNRRSTYKYAAPVFYRMNGDLIRDRYAIWVPNDFPLCQSASGRADNSEQSPVAWAVWSLGPRPDKSKALSNKAPLAGSTWYRRTGDNGVIARFKARQGAARNTL